MALDQVNWNAPWLVPYKTIGKRLAEHVLAGSPVHKALNETLISNQKINCPVRFVSQEQAQGAAAYESFIWQTKTVPTRDNLHDFFNGLVWLHFPKIKARLNALQATEIQTASVTRNCGTGIQKTRGLVRDSLTLFDENSAFLIESKLGFSLIEAIQNKAWRHVFVERRDAWQSAQLIIFGHALLEKLVLPRKALTAHVFCPPSALRATNYAALDDAISTLITPANLATKPYAPLPVMGVPSWCEANYDPQFYEDAQVFRVLLN